MANASKTVTMNVSIDKIWSVITDYENYPKFVDMVHKVKPIEQGDGRSKMEYAIEMMGKDISYTIEHVETKPTQMKWTCVESNVLKANDGSWQLKDLGNGKTEVTYTVDIEFKIPVPSLILGGVVRSTLPKMLEGFEKEARKR